MGEFSKIHIAPSPSSHAKKERKEKRSKRIFSTPKFSGQ
jgi:hypothetical protein